MFYFKKFSKNEKIKKPEPIYFRFILSILASHFRDILRWPICLMF
jgi:hypothetical protein